MWVFNRSYWDSSWLPNQNLMSKDEKKSSDLECEDHISSVYFVNVGKNNTWTSSWDQYIYIAFGFYFTVAFSSILKGQLMKNGAWEKYGWRCLSRPRVRAQAGRIDDGISPQLPSLSEQTSYFPLLLSSGPSYGQPSLSAFPSASRNHALPGMWLLLIFQLLELQFLKICFWFQLSNSWICFNHLWKSKIFFFKISFPICKTTIGNSIGNNKKTMVILLMTVIMVAAATIERTKNSSMEKELWKPNRETKCMRSKNRGRQNVKKGLFRRDNEARWYEFQYLAKK